MPYPATFDVQPPQTFDKAQVALRILIILIVLFVLHVFVLVPAYLLLPVIAAILISQKGGEQYLEEAQQGPVLWLRYVMMFLSYVALATDRLSTEQPAEVVSFEVRTTGKPTVGDALMRLVLAIPHGFVLVFLGVVFIVVWIASAISIFTGGSVPAWASDYIRGYLRWIARVFAYLASLVEEYPPFSLSAEAV